RDVGRGGDMGRERRKEGRGRGVAKGTRKPNPSEPLHESEVLAALRAFRRGDFSVRLRDDMPGIDGQIAETFNDLVAMVTSIESEAREVCRAVGKDGQAARRMRRLGAAGAWGDYVTSVNDVLDDPNRHAKEIHSSATAAA